ncbi:MAG TPA: alpha/beta hydrolase [Thermoanaerobaculia bacterium]|nr:alpha/beta hydrolase [Thermoanaerobaculia bacterium]
MTEPAASATPQALTLEGAGVRLRGYDWGNPAARPLVLVHGIEDFALALAPLAEALRDDYHVVAFDLRGHGDSDQPGVYTMGHFIADLHAVIVQLQLERPILIGHSLGGQIVCQYAGVFPEVPRAVVNIDGMGPPMRLPEPDGEEKQLRTREAIEGLLRPAGHGRPMMDLEDATHLYLRYHPRLDPALARHLVELGTEEHPHGGLRFKWDSRIHTLRLSSTPELAEERFRWAECPVLLVSAGEVDEFMWRRRGLDPSSLRKEPEEIRRRMALFRDADHVEIPGAGHHVHFDAPGELIRVLREFLGRVR